MDERTRRAFLGFSFFIVAAGFLLMGRDCSGREESFCFFLGFRGGGEEIMSERDMMGFLGHSD